MAERDPVLVRCREAIGAGSKSFAHAARLFDPRTRDAAHLLYAWCRYCDDQIDGQTLGHPGGGASPESGEARLERLREQTRRALRGEPSVAPEFVALHRVMALYGIPERYPFELLDGFAMDVAGRLYPELDDTLRYCYHVAGVVGVMMAHLMGARGQEALRRATDLGLALQLTNIARDVVPDAAVGRVYLPCSWLEEEGVEPEAVAAPRHRAALARVTRRLLGEADRYYASADRGLVFLSWRSAWAIATARAVYSEIGRIVEARGPAAWERRAVVTRSRQLALAASALATALGRRSTSAPEPELWSSRLSLD